MQSREKGSRGAAPHGSSPWAWLQGMLGACWQPRSVNNQAEQSEAGSASVGGMALEEGPTAQIPGLRAIGQLAALNSCWRVGTVPW